MSYPQIVQAIHEGLFRRGGGGDVWYTVLRQRFAGTWPDRYYVGTVREGMMVRISFDVQWAGENVCGGLDGGGVVDGDVIVANRVEHGKAIRKHALHTPARLPGTGEENSARGRGHGELARYVHGVTATYEIRWETEFL